MRLILFLILFLVIQNLNGQDYSSYISLPENGDTIYYKSDKAPAYSNSLDFVHMESIVLNTVKSSITQRIVVKKYDKKYQSFKGIESDAELLLQQNGKERWLVKPTEYGLKLEGELLEGGDKSIRYKNEYFLYKFKNEEKTWTLLKDDKSETVNNVIGEKELVLPSGVYDVLMIESIHADDSHSYTFYAKEYVLPIAKISVVNDQIVRVEYQVFSDLEKDRYNASLFDEPLINVYPNPSFGKVRFEFNNYPKGKYSISLYNIIGKNIWEKEFNVGDNGIIKIDFSFLEKGTYLYTVLNEKSIKLTTKRLLIISP